MNYLDLVLENPESTVVAKYVRDNNIVREEHYQSEAELERAFIKQLNSQAYERLFIHTEQDLIINLRQQLERLNNYIFSETEWKRFFNEVIANKNSSIADKSEIIQQNEIQLLTRDDGTTKNIRLVDKVHIHNNHLQVLNQYEVNETPRQNRYDVTVLINGLPLVHIELKRRGVDIREAFNQINRYQRESFWAGSGLFEYVQLFVISNGTLTKYYSNSTRDAHLKEQQGNHRRKQKTSNSFEFTSWWADAENKPITELMDFTKTFFAKHSLLKILFRYCVFTSDRLLLVMRPYQIVATEQILNKLNIAQNYKQFGSVNAGGYIWHTTGSGKTLTSFKTAQLASQLPFIHKVLFVVDRKDLDYQTMKEYDKFQQGAANSNTSTKILTQQLSDPNAKIIITTIQKLAIFIKRQSSHQILNENMVLIFDECHRSQFGEMHQAITKAFKKYALFGFTGTPIFAQNTQQNIRTLSSSLAATTEQMFGKKLHTYTIVNAIADKNVLPFRVDYIRTIKEADDIKDKKVSDIDRERALNAPERIAKIVTYILQHFAQKTLRNKSYFFNRLLNIEHLASVKDRRTIEEIRTKMRLSGFNSIFAVSSIDVAKSYYQEFQRQQAALPEAQKLKIATIFSYGANNEFDEDNIDDENSENTEGLSISHRDFLENAITDYNQLFNTTYDTSAEKFQNYYRDVSLRMKNREIDLLIVVNMFLTGFDATTLNTLWVDKNLKMHGLLQAYSRTNRILNSVKRFGNIVCFRNLEKATNESIALFGDKEAGGLVLMKSFQDYYEGYEEKGKKQRGYTDIVAELLEKFPIGERVESEKAKKEFIQLYGIFLKLQNILSVFDQFSGMEILTERNIQDYHSLYIDIYEEFRPSKSDAENINDDIVFEMELIKQVEINIDYILELIRQYHAKNCQDKELLVSIEKAVDSSIELRNKKELIQTFIHSLTPNADIDEGWCVHIEQAKQEELNEIIHKENLNAEATQKFIEIAFENGTFSEAGTLIDKVLPPMSRFTPDNQRSKIRQTVLSKLKAFFERFFGI